MESEALSIPAKVRVKGSPSQQRSLCTACRRIGCGNTFFAAGRGKGVPPRPYKQCRYCNEIHYLDQKEKSMPELSPSARKVLEDAGDDGFLFINSGGLKGGVAVQVRRSLLNAGLIERLPFAGQGDEFQDGDGAYALRITDAGKTAVGGQNGAAQAPNETPAPPPAAAAKPRAARENTKRDQLITMLRREEGATVDECSSAFGWQAHTTRAAISTLPKKDAALKPTSEKVEGRGRVYRLPAE